MTLAWGSQAPLQAPSAMASALHIAVLGGSVSCGAYVPMGARGVRIRHPSVDATSRSLRGGGLEHAWPTLLQSVLQSHWHAPVHVYNLCERAVGSACEVTITMIARGGVAAANGASTSCESSAAVPRQTRYRWRSGVK